MTFIFKQHSLAGKVISVFILSIMHYQLLEIMFSNMTRGMFMNNFMHLSILYDPQDQLSSIFIL